MLYPQTPCAMEGFHTGIYYFSEIYYRRLTLIMEHNLHALSWRISLGIESKDIFLSTLSCPVALSISILLSFYNYPII